MDDEKFEELKDSLNQAKDHAEGEKEEAETVSSDQVVSEDTTTYAVKIPGDEGEEDKKIEVSEELYEYVKHLKEKLSKTQEVIAAKENTITKLNRRNRELAKNAQVGNR